MTDLVVRKIPWEFDATVPFMWQPANPSFGLFCNAFTFIAVPFERYIVNTVRKAQGRLNEDPDVAAEADAFLRQEAQHAAAHRKHMIALVERYPELERCYEDANEAYDELIDERPIEFHAAYIANLEATFTPLFKVILDNRDSLFGGGDRRVASLMMWHFVEEIEHRSSGLMLCRHINSDPWYRVKKIRETFRHVGKLSASIAETFDEVIPFADRGVSAQDLMSNSPLVSDLKYRLSAGRRRRPGRDRPPDMFHAVPTGQLVKMVWRLALSQTPHHDPADQPLPKWANTWMREYDRGTDMTAFVLRITARGHRRKVIPLLSTNYGSLVPEDELLTHQIVDTFATVSQSDPSWTEKIWTIAHARDNSLQVVLGIGKYTNRGVFDGAAGVCRGTEQWTMRAGRRLSSDPASTDVGPIHYRVVEPLRAVRVSLDATEHAPIAFDVELRGSFNAALEDPWPDRSPDGYRVTHNVLRYHQIGVASGWVEVNGARTSIDADKWISIRDHSWGLRPGVGKPIPGLPRGGRRIKQMFMTWLPMTLTRADGSAYSLFVFYQEERGDGFTEIRCQAEQQNPDESWERFASVEQDMHFQDDNRRFTHGTITLIDSSGTKRPLTITAAGPTGFHLGTAGYYGWNDWVYGQWVGDLKVEGNHMTDCDDPNKARELHQLRDLLVRVEDPVGGGTGLGNAETFALGAFPERGLTAENSFL